MVEGLGGRSQVDEVRASLRDAVVAVHVSQGFAPLHPGLFSWFPPGTSCGVRGLRMRGRGLFPSFPPGTGDARRVRMHDLDGGRNTTSIHVIGNLVPIEQREFL